MEMTKTAALREQSLRDERLTECGFNGGRTTIIPPEKTWNANLE
jgi:hypothetical protein